MKNLLRSLFDLLHHPKFVAENPYKIGDRVRIVRGGLTDVEAVVQGITRSGVLLLDMNGQNGRVEMKSSEVERL